MALLGYSFWGEIFEDDSVSLTNVKLTEYSGSIIDEISLRSRADISNANVKDTLWNNDQNYLAKFLNSLEAGNIGNDGVKIVKFRIVRRLADQNQSDDIYMGELPFTAGTNVDLSYEDVTNPNEPLIYTIFPIGENGLFGNPREIEHNSSFTGVWIVDKDSGNVLAFDKAIGSVGSVESILNLTRTQIDTFSNYPQYYYGQQNFESFTLSTVILPEESERTGKKYKEILDKFVLDHKPKIVKTDNGKILVCDISNIRSSTPLNTWDQHDYITLNVDVTEVANYEEYMKNS